jgi:paired amphipathic helix protein Sin3a
MTNQPFSWNNQRPLENQRPLGQQFNRQHPPVLPPPATLETGGQPFYPLPSLPSLGSNQSHPPSGHGFNIPSISSVQDQSQMQQQDASRQNELRRSSSVALPNPSTQLPPSTTIPPPHEHLTSITQSILPDGIPNRSSTSSLYRPLNVKDALSYLDDVKNQFSDQAEVYNNFLDIMKDFKSQSIDTPGVIDRVSTLFRGHPNLIQGFNTFLPPGYSIECSFDPSDPNPIRVTTPTGTTTRPNVSNKSFPPVGPNALSNAEASTRNVLGVPGFPGGQDQQAGGHIEFNHAITYVNKIKTRFANQPDIYKQFLEILQTYQREQKPIGEVYEQVTVLFANSPDLLDDFKQFLPDTSSQVYQQQQQQFGQKPNGFYPNGQQQLPPVGNFQPPSGTTGLSPGEQQHFGNQFHMPQADQSPEPKFDQSAPKKKKSISEPLAFENNYNQHAELSSVRGGQAKGKTAQGKNGIATNPTLVPGVPEPMPLATSVKSSSLSEEISFFDKVKKAIGNKQSYNDFLKLLNLFSQDIIDKQTLVERVDGFIGETHPELFNWFKMFVGYEEKPLHIENITFKKHQLELSLCQAYGPSYRKLPKAETYMPCSGRDAMCWEVLNDQWVGHPTWASEDSGFIAHRKNQYEEILFKIEEERLEFDYYMESNLRTIQTLEALANRIANMTPEQKANFKLPLGLGHNSQTIYKKVIRKIYDKDRGFEVIDALHENPAIAVPIVLKRLKQKDEEWKRAQREWNKVWREMEQKVFYKSLDHLGLTFKQADKKLLTVKQLVSEISTVKVEQQNKRLHPLTPKPQEQLNYKFEDNSVLIDILRLSGAFINKSSNYSASDRERLEQFFHSFMSLFFGIDADEIDKVAIPKEKTENEQEESTTSQGSQPETSQVQRKRGREVDLLRDVLKRKTKSRKEDRNDAPSSQVEESDDQELSDELEKSSELWIKTANTKLSLKDENVQEEKRLKYNFFCNTTIYVFFRHLTTLYERLFEVKQMNDIVGKELRSRKTPQFAKDLNLLSHQLEDMGVEISGKRDCYQQVLELSSKLIEGEVEHQWVEEALRQGYRNRAYKLYTIDKVVQAMVKHMYSIITDSKTSEMVVSYETDRSKPVSSAKEQILYRMQVRSLMGADENMFKITYKESDASVNIQFVGLDDLTLNEHENAEERYNYYVTSYIMSNPTEGVPASKLNMPFSRAFIDNVDEDQCEGYVNLELKVSICENSYRLFFESGSHDEFTSNSLFKKRTDDPKTKEAKVEELKELINSDEIGWKHVLGDNEDAALSEEKVKLLFEKGAEAIGDFENKRKEETNGEAVPKNEVADAEKETDKNPEEKTEESTTKDDEKVDTTIDENEKSTTAHDPDSTDIQENNDNNDTTIHQDVNDTTTDDTTVNQDEISITE